MSCILVFSVGCENEKFNDKDKSVISFFKKGKISPFIDFDNDIQVLDNDCLLKFTESLLGIVWSDNDSLIRGISFTPKVSNNPYSHLKGEKKWLCFHVSSIDGKDTTYSYEAYYFNGYFNALNPCYFDSPNTLRVDSVIEIVPNLLILKENCILNITRTDLAPGVFEKVDYIQ